MDNRYFVELCGTKFMHFDLCDLQGTGLNFRQSTYLLFLTSFLFYFIMNFRNDKIISIFCSDEMKTFTIWVIFASQFSTFYYNQFNLLLKKVYKLKKNQFCSGIHLLQPFRALQRDVRRLQLFARTPLHRRTRLQFNEKFQTLKTVSFVKFQSKTFK